MYTWIYIHLRVCVCLCVCGGIYQSRDHGYAFVSPLFLTTSADKQDKEKMMHITIMPMQYSLSIVSLSWTSAKNNNNDEDDGDNNTDEKRAKEDRITAAPERLCIYLLDVRRGNRGRKR